MLSKETKFCAEYVDDDSVTRFNEISPLWQKITSLWHIFDN